MNCADVGKFISELRKEKRMTQRELAQKLHITDKAVSKWERGISYPDNAILAELADILDVSVTELLSGQKISEKGTFNCEDVLIESLSEFEREEKQQKKRTQKRKIIVCILVAIVFLGIAWAGNKKAEITQIERFFSAIENDMACWETGPRFTESDSIMPLNTYIQIKSFTMQLGSTLDNPPDSLKKMKYQDIEKLYLALKKNTDKLYEILQEKIHFDNENVSVDESVRKNYIEIMNSMSRDFLKVMDVNVGTYYNKNPFMVLYNILEYELITSWV